MTGRPTVRRRGSGLAEEQAATRLLCLGALAPAFDLDDALATLEGRPISWGVDLLSRHKARRIALARLEQADTGHEFAASLLDAFRARIAPTLRRQESVAEIVHEVDGLAVELGIAVAGIKGLSARSMYDLPEQREVSDVDVHVAHETDAWKLTAGLRSRGFTFDEEELPWVKTVPATGHVYGQSRLGRVIDEDGYRLYVDVHFGGYSVRHCGLIPLDAPSSPPGYSLVQLTPNLPLLVANAAGDCFVTVKDLNDLYLYLARADVDLDAAAEVLARAGLGEFLAWMIERLRAMFDLDPVRSAAADRLAAAATPERGLSLLGTSWRRRWWLTVQHAARLDRAESLASAARATWSAATYYWKPLRLHVDSRRRRRRVAAPDPDRWTCVRLVPVDVLATLDEGSPHTSASNRVGSIEREPLALEDGDLVTAAGELFVPTSTYRLDRALVRRALELSQAGRLA
jgi:hypothetical protein